MTTDPGRMSDADLAAEVRRLSRQPDDAHARAVLAAAADRLDLCEPLELHRHTPHWYSSLGAAHGHPGYVNLAEIRDAERTGWQPPDEIDPVLPPRMMP